MIGRIFVTCRSAIKVNECQLSPCVEKYDGYIGLNCGGEGMVINLQCASKASEIQIYLAFGQIPRLQLYILANSGLVSSLVNLQSK